MIPFSPSKILQSNKVITFHEMKHYKHLQNMKRSINIFYILKTANSTFRNKIILIVSNTGLNLMWKI